MSTPAAAEATVVETAGQHLPVPLGGSSPFHASPPRPRAVRLRRHWRMVLVVLGCAAAGGGIALTATHSDIAVFADVTGVHVGNLTLHQRDSGVPGERVFAGDAVLAIAMHGTNTFEGSGVALVQGRRSVGSCTMTVHAETTVEDCDLRLGATRLRAHDVYSAARREWLRRYADGTEITMQVPPGSSVIPIPFPIGAPLS
ncbi:MAG TPA: hypothetical protein VJU79_03835 [Candidatus Dormibacteraeota bacterium]|nr:hypothetical protein [Candidatus Dormibacteraeota bacterium]